MVKLVPLEQQTRTEVDTDQKDLQIPDPNAVPNIEAVSRYSGSPRQASGELRNPQRTPEEKTEARRNAVKVIEYRKIPDRTAASLIQYTRRLKAEENSGTERPIAATQESVEAWREVRQKKRMVKGYLARLPEQDGALLKQNIDGVFNRTQPNDQNEQNPVHYDWNGEYDSQILDLLSYIKFVDPEGAIFQVENNPLDQIKKRGQKIDTEQLQPTTIHITAENFNSHRAYAQDFFAYAEKATNSDPRVKIGRGVRKTMKGIEEGVDTMVGGAVDWAVTGVKKADNALGRFDDSVRAMKHDVQMSWQNLKDEVAGAGHSVSVAWKETKREARLGLASLILSKEDVARLRQKSDYANAMDNSLGLYTDGSGNVIDITENDLLPQFANEKNPLIKGKLESPAVKEFLKKFLGDESNPVARENIANKIFDTWDRLNDSGFTTGWDFGDPGARLIGREVFSTLDPDHKVISKEGYKIMNPDQSEYNDLMQLVRGLARKVRGH
jgi:hypothetical protein